MRALLGLFVAVAGLTFFQSSETDEILAQLSKIRLDKKQIYNLRDITIRRDAVSISFNRGAIAFMEPVRGKVTGAVFLGSGEIVAMPPDAVEKQQLHRFTNSPILNEPFGAAFFRFTDNTYEEILKQYESQAHEDGGDNEAAQFLPWDQILADRSGVLNYRLLADYLGTPKPLFFAEFNGDRTGWFDVVFDPRFAEEVAIMKVHEQNSSFSIDIWSSFNQRGQTRDLEAAARENKTPLDVQSYDIDATITRASELDAVVWLRAKARTAGDRVVSFDLSRFLRVSSVTLEAGEAIPFFQHVGWTVEEIRRSSLNAVVVVLPKATVPGEDVTLKFTYAGDVIEKKGSGIFYVGERGRWYPNFGTPDRANFKLKFTFPSQYSLVATGRKTKELEEGATKSSFWESENEIPVAGFNLGDFTILSDDSGPVPIRVGVNNDVETIYREVASRKAMLRDMAIRATSTIGRRGQSIVDSAPSQPDFNVFSTRGLAENVLKGVKDTLTFFVDQFGSYPYSQLTVSQFPVNYSQGWPSLLYVSTLSFFTKEQRDKLGLTSEADFMVTEMVRAHEIAHQWFGNKVGWSTYHDQWISEAFANYAGAMYIEHKYQDSNRLRTVLEDSRRRLLENSPDGASFDSLGPIWLGQRLGSTSVPDGYSEVTYPKGTWVVHMLRMMMRNDGAVPDSAFLAMVREFLARFDGKVASTWDLKRIAEQHMTPAMDVRGDRKLDWFFDEWVLGTGIPSYSLDYKVRPAAGGFIIEGRIAQSRVPDSFIMPVPLYADNQLLGRVVVSDEDGSFRFVVKTKPSQVSIDPNLTVLTQVRN